MPSDRQNDRQVQLESLLAHLQHESEQMHEVMLAQQVEIDSLRRHLKRLEARLDRTTAEPERHDPIDERPPHY